MWPMVLLRIGSGQPEPSRCLRSTPDGFLALPDTQFGCMHAAAAPTVRSSVREWLIRSQSDSRFGLLHPRKSRNPCTPKMTSLFKEFGWAEPKVKENRNSRHRRDFFWCRAPPGALKKPNTTFIVHRRHVVFC